MMLNNFSSNMSAKLCNSRCVVVKWARSSRSLVRRIEHDAFGNVLSDSDPGLRLPLGFAGGLVDADTGLIRFGKKGRTATTPCGLVSIRCGLSS